MNKPTLYLKSYILSESALKDYNLADHIITNL